MLGKQIAKQMYSLVENNEEALRAALTELEASKTELSSEEGKVDADIEVTKVELGSAEIAGDRRWNSLLPW